MGKKVAHRIDQFLVGLREVGGDDSPASIRDTNPATQVWMDMVERQKKMQKEGKRDPEIDFSFTLQIYPVQSIILGTYHTEKDFLEKLWLDQPIVEAYPYWNNTDRPEDVDPQEWRHRKKLWDQALDQIESPQPAGLTAEGVDTDRGLWLPEPEQMAQLTPSLEERLQHLAKRKLQQDPERGLKKFIRKQLPEDIDEPSSEHLTSNDIIQATGEFSQWTQTPEGQEALQNIKEQLRDQIPHEITPELISMDQDKLQQQASANQGQSRKR